MMAPLGAHPQHSPSAALRLHRHGPIRRRKSLDRGLPRRTAPSVSAARGIEPGRALAADVEAGVTGDRRSVAVTTIAPLSVLPVADRSPRRRRRRHQPERHTSPTACPAKSTRPSSGTAIRPARGAIPAPAEAHDERLDVVDDCRDEIDRDAVVVGNEPRCSAPTAAASMMRVPAESNGVDGAKLVPSSEGVTSTAPVSVAPKGTKKMQSPQDRLAEPLAVPVSDSLATVTSKLSYSTLLAPAAGLRVAAHLEPSGRLEGLLVVAP